MVVVVNLAGDKCSSSSKSSINICSSSSSISSKCSRNIYCSNSSIYGSSSKLSRSSRNYSSNSSICSSSNRSSIYGSSSINIYGSSSKCSRSSSIYRSSSIRSNTCSRSSNYSSNIKTSSRTVLVVGTFLFKSIHVCIPKEKVQPICLPLNAEFHPDDIVGTKPFVAGWADGSEEWYALLGKSTAGKSISLQLRFT